MGVLYILAALAYLEIVVLVTVLGRHLKASLIFSCCIALLWPLSLPIIVWFIAGHIRQLISVATALSGGVSSEEG
jgi:hypothetical protein